MDLKYLKAYKEFNLSTFNNSIKFADILLFLFAIIWIVSLSNVFDSFNKISSIISTINLLVSLLNISLLIFIIISRLR